MTINDWFQFAAICYLFVLMFLNTENTISVIFFKAIPAVVALGLLLTMLKSI